MKPHRGFIALMSSIIISAILLVVVVAASITGFTTRFNMLDAEAKQQSAALADACLDILMLRLVQGTTPNALVTEAACTISNAASPYKISAMAGRAHTNLLVTVNATPAIVSIQETPN
jgi:hypothetical protein